MQERHAGQRDQHADAGGLQRGAGAGSLHLVGVESRPGRGPARAALGLARP